MTAQSDINNIKDTLKWAIGVMILLLLSLITGAVRAEIRTSSNEIKIEKIQQDYLPYSAFQYIIESNTKLMNLLTAIESKDDQRYKDAMEDWSKLQNEVIKQAGFNKTRGGHSMVGGSD